MCARGLRFVEWVWDPDSGDTHYLVDYAFLLRDRDGSARVEHDRHVEGLFSRQRWLTSWPRSASRPAAYRSRNPR